MNAKSAVELTSMPSEWALRELPARAATFLHTVGGHAPIRAAMQSAGYGRRDHDEGLRLLLAICPYGTGGLDPAEDEPAREASASIQRWARTHVVRLRAAVERLHPEALWVFAGFNRGVTSDALLGTARLLENLRLMAEGKADDVHDGHSEPTRVLETLTRRGLGEGERTRLEALVRTAQRATALAPAPQSATSCWVEPSAEAPDAAMLALHAWLSDWSTTARAVLRRKDWLIRLGVSRRRRRE